MPWPCDTARLELAQRYGADRVGLSKYLSDQLFLAEREAPGVATEMFDRFVAWTG